MPLAKRRLMADDDDPFARLLQQAAYLDVEDVPWRAGDQLCEGRFELCRRLGGGGMGVVFSAFDAARGERVALKTVRQAAPEMCAALEREFQLLRTLTHPRIVRVIEGGNYSGRPFFTMELIDGSPISDPRHAGAALWGALVDVADALCHLHRGGHVHCDIKPANVMATPSGRGVLLDFGIASEPGQPTRGAGGTSLFAAPELARGGAATAASDWFSFGVMLNELAANERLIESEAHAGRSSGSGPSTLRHLIQDLGAPDPGMRPSGDDTARRLRALAR